MIKIKPDYRDKVKCVYFGIEFPRTLLSPNDRRFGVKPKQKKSNI